MRFTVTIDSADTDEIRAAMVALHHIGRTAQLATGVNGPYAWCGTTPALSEDEFADWITHFRNHKAGLE